MALQNIRTMESYDDGSPVQCSYHKVRVVAYEVGSGTGVSYQSYIDADDFAVQGWNAPRAGGSVFWPNVAPGSVPVVNWAEEQIIARETGWTTAQQVA
ncbi:MAG: hypothetical protein ACXU82_03785 [Caulobacteraceae bacterium]